MGDHVRKGHLELAWKQVEANAVPRIGYTNSHPLERIRNSPWETGSR